MYSSTFPVFCQAPRRRLNDDSRFEEANTLHPCSYAVLASTTSNTLAQYARSCMVVVELLTTFRGLSSPSR